MNLTTSERISTAIAASGNAMIRLHWLVGDQTCQMTRLGRRAWSEVVSNTSAMRGCVPCAADTSA